MIDKLKYFDLIYIHSLHDMEPVVTAAWSIYLLQGTTCRSYNYLLYSAIFSFENRCCDKVSPLWECKSFSVQLHNRAPPCRWPGCSWYRNGGINRKSFTTMPLVYPHIPVWSFTSIICERIVLIVSEINNPLGRLVIGQFIENLHQKTFNYFKNYCIFQF